MIETRALHVFVQVKGQDGVFVSVPVCLHSEVLVDGSNIGAFAGECHVQGEFQVFGKAGAGDG